MTGASGAAQLAEGIAAGDRRALARGITLVESTRAADQTAAQELLQQLAPRLGAARRIGITGAPGAGKSTFIDTLGCLLTSRDHRVAVLAVDPSSALSGGSILGDKTRMERLARDPHAFVRPSPGGSAHGGVARRTREAALLCEAAGFDVVLIETIGVGQSELAVAGMVDTFVLLLLAGGGDELQGIKRGVMELADIVVLHKADGDAATRAAAAAAEYRRALELLPSATSGWRVPVLTASAHSGAGVAEVFDAVEAHRAARGAEGLTELRRRQAEQWFDDTLHELLLERALRDPAVAAALDGIREQVRLGSIQPTAAALAVLALHGR